MTNAQKGLLILGLVVVTGCVEVAEEGSEGVPVTVELPAAFVAQSAIGKILLSIHAPDIATPITAELTQPIPSTPAFSVSVPPGSAREFEVFVTIAADPKSGFVGKTVTDISTSGGTVPVDMKFVNFTDDLIRTEDPFDVIDSASNSNPDIDFVKVTQGSCGTISDAVIFLIDLEDNFFPDTSEKLNAFIEFDVDVNPLTGSNPTKIERQKSGTTLSNSFQTGSEVYLLAEVDPVLGASAQVSAFDANTDVNLDPSIPGDLTPPFGGTYSGSTDNVFSICVYRRVFNTFIDADNQGAFNILVGMFSFITSSFRPNDIAYRAGTIIYDLNFDTSGL